LVTRAAAALVGLVREVHRLPLNDGECEAEGLPYGSTVRAVHCLPLGRSPWWALDGWVAATAGEPRCLHLRLLGCYGEVWFRARKAP